MMLCRWCASTIADDQSMVGFGRGDGKEYVHRDCWDEYDKIRMVLSGTVAFNSFLRLVRTHQRIIQELEINREKKPDERDQTRTNLQNRTT